MIVMLLSFLHPVLNITIAIPLSLVYIFVLLFADFVNAFST